MSIHRIPFKWGNANFAYNENPFGIKHYKWNVVSKNKIPFKWNTSNFTWNAWPWRGTPSRNPYTWGDVALITEIIDIIEGGGGYNEVLQHVNKPEKRRRFIKLLCNVKGTHFEDTKEILNKKINIEDVSLVVDSLKININVKIK